MFDVRRTSIIVLAGMVAIATLVARPAAASFPGTNGLIAFQSQAGYDASPSDYEIWTVGSQITANAVQDFTPSWSPDGTKIAIARRSGPNNTDEIFVMDSDGTNEVQLTNNSIDDDEPAWSPNGRRLVFTRTSSAAHGPDLFAMDAADRDHNGRGDHLVRLTTHRGSGGFQDPAWSPNGKRIAFSRSVGPTNNDIFTMRAAPLSRTNRPKRLTKDPAPSTFFDAYPDWSPDGTKIAFETNRFGHYDIAVMNSNGTGLTALTNDPASDGDPVFSPDGSLIAYDRSTTGGGDIFVMHADGSDAPGTNNTNTTVNDVNPTWQPLP